MQNVKGKTAFITGGASGIGLGMCQAFINAGMKVVIADIRQEALDRALTTLQADTQTVLPVQLDVTDRKAWVRAADKAEQTFGPVQVLCNNAGITIDGPMPQGTYADWDFCLGVNLGGVVNGVMTFMPRMIAQHTEAHIVNTSSMGGLIAGAGSGIYSTSKYAVVGLTEELRSDLAQYGIGVSVFCPGPTQTELFDSSVAVRPGKLAETGYVPRTVPKPDEMPADIAAAIFAIAMKPAQVGERVLRGIQRNDMYILTHPEFSGIIQARCEAILASMPNETITPERARAANLLLTDKLYSEQIARVKQREG
ncbi:MAG: SDR family NAD(P)-dependent oxidoreductase [Gammaproteobacteria bacterium]|nr:SDR family NAD(P)-dependent oxidoreductase [Gammaproteobacteria bacterium]